MRHASRYMRNGSYLKKYSAMGHCQIAKSADTEVCNWMKWIRLAIAGENRSTPVQIVSELGMANELVLRSGLTDCHQTY